MCLFAELLRSITLSTPGPLLPSGASVARKGMAKLCASYGPVPRLAVCWGHGHPAGRRHSPLWPSDPYLGGGEDSMGLTLEETHSAFVPRSKLSSALLLPSLGSSDYLPLSSPTGISTASLICPFRIW